MAQFRFIGTATREHSTESFRSATGTFPSWTMEPDDTPTCQECLSTVGDDSPSRKSREKCTESIGSYHAGTSLPGRISALVDPGARVSMAGQSALQALARLASRVGLKVTQERMAKPMHFQGVGEGSPEAHWQAKIPCAIPCDDTTRVMEFTVPSVTGTGNGLPILYGLDNMERHNAVLEMDPTKRQLTFPGPGGYIINWSPGTVHIPLQPTPSGHLAFPLDHYDKCNTKHLEQKSLAVKKIILHPEKPSINTTSSGHSATSGSSGPAVVSPQLAATSTRPFQ